MSDSMRESLCRAMGELTRFDLFQIFHEIERYTHTSTPDGFFWDLEKWEDSDVERLWSDVQQRRKRIADVMNLEKSRVDFMGTLALDLGGGTEALEVKKRNDYITDEGGRSIRVLYSKSDLSPTKATPYRRRPTGKFYVEDTEVSAPRFGGTLLPPFLTCFHSKWRGI